LTRYFPTTSHIHQTSGPDLHATAGPSAVRRCQEKFFPPPPRAILPRTPLQPQPAKISQETLTEMVGTTRSLVSFFMNRFRKLGFIDYHAGDALQVHSSLLNIVLHD
jgi:hypothetical protein